MRTGRLFYGGELVKRFSHRAPDQEIILTIFELQGWPPSIHDPLPWRAGCRAKRRLNKTIEHLNRAQIHPLIRFFGDGSGQRICWRPASQKKSDWAGVKISCK